MWFSGLVSHILVSFKFFQLMYEIMENLFILENVLVIPCPFKLSQLSAICIIIPIIAIWLNFINFFSNS